MTEEKIVKQKISSRVDTFYLWALSLGLAVGWGAFVMPGSTFLPLAGPVGTAAGFIIGALIMIAIGACYSYMIGILPDSGGAYAYTRDLLGYDHAFLASWALILAYMSILWANATAFILIGRYLARSYIQWGFHYTVADYDVYLSEIIITLIILVVFAFIAARDHRKGRIAYFIMAVIMLAGAAFMFFGGFIRSGDITNYTPAFSEESFTPGLQIFNIVIFAPWAYVGFEAIGHSVGYTSVKPKKYFGLMALGLVSAALIYVFMTGVSLISVPEEYTSWVDYIGEGTGGTVIQKFPVYYSVLDSLGNVGLFVLIIAMIASLSTSLIGFYRILANILATMAQDGLLPKKLTHTNKYGIHDNAIKAVMLVSMIIPFLGRVTIGWIIDITTISVSIVYCYVSICTYISAKKNNSLKYRILGIFGIVVSALFFIFPIIPNPFVERTLLSTRSYILLVGWSMLGLIFYWMMFRKDRQSRLGHSMIMWMLMLFLIFFTAVIWFEQTAMKLGDFSTEAARSEIKESTFAEVMVIIAALLITYSIFTIMRRRTTESNIRRIQAEERSKAKTIFLSNMSHDIRTPMNAIVGYTALARDPSANKEEVKEYLDKIDAASTHLLELINDLLEMSSIEAGKRQLNEEAFDICRLVTDAGDMFRQQMKAKNITFNVDTEQVKDRIVICDKVRMNRVLLNLISNAYKFTPDNGEVGVILKEVGAAAPDHTAAYVIIVKDNGIGMSEEFAAHVFDAFERERSATVSKIEGTGLGMSITKGIVDMMGGRIGVRSKQGSGSEFTIELRLKLSENPDETANAAGIPSAADKAIDSSRFKGRKALLVEDMKVNREMAKRILTKFGFEVDTAKNGRQAVEYVSKCVPGGLDIILMDIRMPEMDGYEASRRIRDLSDERLKNIPIIALTANAFESDIQAAAAAGMNGHIAKPLNIQDMIKEIDRVLN